MKQSYELEKLGLKIIEAIAIGTVIPKKNRLNFIEEIQPIIF
jgi:hypothetical protein